MEGKTAVFTLSSRIFILLQGNCGTLSLPRSNLRYWHPPRTPLPALIANSKVTVYLWWDFAVFLNVVKGCLGDSVA